MMCILIIAFLIGADQFVKFLIEKNIALGNQIVVIDNFFYITFWTNKGAAWGILQGNRMFLILVTIVALLLMIYMFENSKNNLIRIAISIIVGGALGNFIDRIFRDNGVVDFLLFYLGTYQFPAFNVADVSIVCGTIMLIVATLFEQNEKKEDSEK